MGNETEYSEEISKNSAWALLPIRFYHHGFAGHSGIYDRFSSVGRYENGVELCKEVVICPSPVYFAKSLWERSVEIILKEFPHLTDIQFEMQNEEGVYPIVFPYSIEEIAEKQCWIMNNLIDSGFSINEYLIQKITESQGRRELCYRGVIECSREDLERVFYHTRYGEPLEVRQRRNVSFSYDECKQYFKTFDEKMMILGNQRAAYQALEPRNHALFEAASAGDKNTITKLIESGFSINEISPSGDTAFSLLLEHLIINNGTSDITEDDEKYLEYLYQCGANVNLIGVDEMAEPPLFRAFLCHAERLFQWLLDHGANPNAEVDYDFPYSIDLSHTIKDWMDRSL